MKISIELDNAGNVTALQVDGRDHNVAPRQAPPTGLQPGQVIVDVGTQTDPAQGYRGTLDPDTLTREEWAFWAAHPELWAKQGQILTKPAFVGIPGTSYAYTPGDLATVEHPDGTRLQPFLD